MSGKYALIIGNTEYTDSGLAQLTAPGKDAEDFARVLGNKEICAFDEVKTLLNQSSHIIREAIDEFFYEKRPDDLLVLYFSGHGVRDELGALYLAVKNSNRFRLRSTAIKSDFIRESMDQSRSKRQVLILDCCNSGAFSQGTKAATGGSMGTSTAFESGYGRIILTASDATQYAWEGNKVIGETDNSLFTHFLVEGLEGNADRDGDGKITVDELYDYAYEQIKQATPKQTPSKFSSKQQGEIYLRESMRFDDIKPIPLPSDLIDEAEDLRPYVREAAVQKLERILKGTNIGLAHSAIDTLQKIAEDENTTKRVAQVAIQVLESYYQVERKAEEERRAKEEAERLALLKAEEERLAREKMEAEQKAKKEAEKLARAKAAREVAEQEAARLKAEREAAEREVARKAEQEAIELASRKKAEREATEKAAKEKAKREATEKTAKEKAEREAVISSPKNLKPIYIGLIIIVFCIAYFGSRQNNPIQSKETTPTVSTNASPTEKTNTPSNFDHSEYSTSIASFNITSTARVPIKSTANAQATDDAKFFYDDFSNNSKGWFTGSIENDWYIGSQAISEGVFVWDVTEVKKSVVSRLSSPVIQSFDDFYLGVENFYLGVDAFLKQGNPANSCYGLYFRGDWQGSFYWFSVCDNQTFKVSYFDGTAWESLIDRTNSSTIQPGNWNRIEVIVVGSDFEFYINNVLVEQVSDSQSTAGQFGIFIDIDEPCQIWFDNFEFKLR